MVTLLPAMASMSLYWSGRFVGGSTAARFLAPLGIQVLGLVLMNKLLPRTNVTWKAALVGALFTAVVLEAGKFGFVRFAKTMLLDSYSGVYGSLGLIPLLLIWIYASWLMVLLGAEIAFAVQNLRVLEAEDRRTRGDEPINGLLAAQLLSVVAAAHEQSGTGVREDATGDGVRTDRGRGGANRGSTEAARVDRRGTGGHQRIHPWTRRQQPSRSSTCWRRSAPATSNWRTAPPRPPYAPWSPTSRKRARNGQRA